MRWLERVAAAVRRFEGLVLGPRPPPEAFCLATIHPPSSQVQNSPNSTPRFDLKSLIGDGFLWGVPKSRRTIEKRLKRKFGHPDYVWKMLVPHKDIKTCNTCGDDHEAGVLCPTCYKKVIEETRAMQDTIQAELKLEPVEQEVVVLYDGEKEGKPEEFFEGKRIVEMKKPRPEWFGKNLLQQTTQKPATSTDVKPSELG